MVGVAVLTAVLSRGVTALINGVSLFRSSRFSRGSTRRCSRSRRALRGLPVGCPFCRRLPNGRRYENMLMDVYLSRRLPIVQAGSSGWLGVEEGKAQPCSGAAASALSVQNARSCRKLFAVFAIRGEVKASGVLGRRSVRGGS